MLPDVVDGEDRGGDEPGNAKNRVDHDANRHDQQIQVVAASFLKVYKQLKGIIFCVLI